jgi:hypothetical protein
LNEDKTYQITFDDGDVLNKVADKIRLHNSMKKAAPKAASSSKETRCEGVELVTQVQKKLRRLSFAERMEIGHSVEVCSRNDLERSESTRKWIPAKIMVIFSWTTNKIKFK